MVDIKGSFSDDNYTWAEDRPGGGGGGPRSMKLLGSGLAANLKWLVTPNPHGNATYNNNQQGLYDGFVAKINQGWPAKKPVKFTALKSFDDIPAKEKPKNHTKLKKPQMDTALKNYNANTKAALEAAEKARYEKLVVAHFAKKKGCKFTYGGVDYKLG